MIFKINVKNKKIYSKKVLLLLTVFLLYCMLIKHPQKGVPDIRKYREGNKVDER